MLLELDLDLLDIEDHKVVVVYKEVKVVEVPKDTQHI